MPRPTLIRSTLLVIALMAIAVGMAACTSPLTTFEPASDAADRILTLYILIIVAASIVGVLVLGAMAYILIKFRARPGREAQQIHGNNKLEIAWTIAPILVLVAITIPTMVWIATSSSRAVADDAILVTATGYQWWFEFEYEGESVGLDGGTLVTANELHLPVGRQVAIELRSEDVIHSFWVPALLGKTDMVPNRENKLEPFVPNEIGEFWGQCAEFCGVAHANMRFRVHVVSLADFDAWVAAMNTAPADPVPDSAPARGKRVFEVLGGCGACHTIAGTAAAGRVGPDLSLFGERSTVGAGILPATDENVRAWVSDLRSIKPGARFMPKFADTLSEAQVADVVAYLKSLRVP
ncbi:MAG: cytochrome c oxidase subunit II [Chloroflexi bacterium]|nr:cytochrome c oxidase subunit II [Chloroflexota bacterium]MCI0815752.1 cytochrome c oxidase subunit II [Chloroflexota bacterium]